MATTFITGIDGRHAPVLIDQKGGWRTNGSRVLQVEYRAIEPSSVAKAILERHAHSRLEVLRRALVTGSRACVLPNARLRSANHDPHLQAWSTISGMPTSTAS